MFQSLIYTELFSLKKYFQLKTDSKVKESIFY